MHADYFDEGNVNENGEPVYTKTSQIRFHWDKGISGFVAKTGKVGIRLNGDGIPVYERI